MNAIASKRCSLCKGTMEGRHVDAAAPGSTSMTVYLCWECDRRKCPRGHVVRDGGSPKCPCGERL